ncbi:zincin-like metallopeptidase domain-containing protein [Sphingomonas sp. S1-29]|uniref:ArdC family protein n=1 Tax=Sphingomonas sp. S1-29 TaxID=2991074 RepID=UPI00223F1DD7|nr:zincin-like metallopeptidase domain-containing protein [Sphingomonas sp. S1-29]UZK69588.1 zincin-like metallopeptidase domain-containing protein [Sphingomonas sp. S1-29]
MKRDIYSTVTAQIIADLENGTAPWARPWKGGASPMTMPRNHVSGRVYSGVNILLLWSAMSKGDYAVNRWLTYKQATDLGGHVRKGERGTTIVYAGSFVPEAEKAKAAQTGKDAASVFFLKSMTVFNLAQCENIGTFEAPFAANDERDRLELADNLFAATGVKVQHGGDKAYYSPGSDFVQMPHSAAFGDLLDYYRTLAHELVHSTGHKSRLDRNILNKFGSVDYAREELVAEIGSAYVCAGIGIEYTTRHADYVANWLTVLREDDRAIFKAASMASKAAQWIEACAPVEDVEELAA